MNWFLYFIFIVVLISSNILLFNEEFLILLCFIAFSVLCYNNLEIIFQSYFEEFNKRLNKQFFQFYNGISSILKSEIYYQKQKINIVSKFFKLKNYYSRLNQKLLIKVLNYQKKIKNQFLNQKIVFISNLEQQFQKLIISLILIKIKKLITLTFFYQKTIKITNLRCIDKLILLEYLKKI